MYFDQINTFLSKLNCVHSNMALAGKVAFVTGAASGLGRATAARFARAGAKVVLCDLPSTAGASVASEIGPNVVFAPADVTKEAEVAAALETAISKFGKLTTVVQCAGIAPPSKILGKKGPHTLDLFTKVCIVPSCCFFSAIVCHMCPSCCMLFASATS